MNESRVDIVTLKPRWSVVDLISRRDEKTCRTRILNQLYRDYLSQGWELADDIHWAKDNNFAVMKIGRTQA
jgi:hypothetical protein